MDQREYPWSMAHHRLNTTSNLEGLSIVMKCIFTSWKTKTLSLILLNVFWCSSDNSSRCRVMAFSADGSLFAWCNGQRWSFYIISAYLSPLFTGSFIECQIEWINGISRDSSLGIPPSLENLAMTNSTHPLHSTPSTLLLPPLLPLPYSYPHPRTPFYQIIGLT